METVHQKKNAGEFATGPDACTCGTEHKSAMIQVCRIKALVETLRVCCSVDAQASPQDPSAARVEFVCDSILPMLSHLSESLAICDGNHLDDASLADLCDALLERIDGEGHTGKRLPEQSHTHLADRIEAERAIWEDGTDTGRKSPTLSVVRWALDAGLAALERERKEDREACERAARERGEDSTPPSSRRMKSTKRSRRAA